MKEKFSPENLERLNKSPDAAVLPADISLVPFHYTYERVHCLMAEEEKSQPGLFAFTPTTAGLLQEQPSCIG